MGQIKVNLGRYVRADSFIHRLDPRAKFFSLICIVTATFRAENFLQLAFWIFFLAFIIKISKIPFSAIAGASRPVLFLAMFTLIFNLISAFCGDDLAGGICRALFTSLRLIVLMMFAMMLPLTTTSLELSDGLDILLRPFGRRWAHECSMMIGMALRFIPLLMEETDRIMRAQISRGARLEQGNLFQKIKAFFPVLIPLFIVIFRRADEIAIAMESRGYDGGDGRTRRRSLSWKTADTLSIIVSAFLLFLI